MKTARTIAMAVTMAALAIGTARVAPAGEKYVFPSVNGAQFAATPAPTFSLPAQQASNISPAGAKFQYGHVTPGRQEPPMPPPSFAYGLQSPSTSRLMSNTLMVAPYANYVADYARLFAPNHALNAWTDRVFGIVAAEYGAVDGWTAAAYGLPRVAGPRRRNESTPDLSPMPKFRAHPELQDNPTFDRQAN